jgi:hypothetical protein
VAYPTPEDTVTPKRRHHGFLSGCLIVVIVAALLAGGGIYYTARNLFREMQNDPNVTEIAETMRRDAAVMSQIGGKFQIMETERSTFPLPKGGFATTYRLTLVGPHGEFRVDARYEPTAKGKKLVSLTLTDQAGNVRHPHPGPAGTAI